MRGNNGPQQAQAQIDQKESREVNRGKAGGTDERPVPLREEVLASVECSSLARAILWNNRGEMTGRW